MNKIDDRLTVVADIGSCHMGRLDYALESIDVAKECGVDFVKFQLFPNSERYTCNGNIPMSWNLFHQCWEHSKNVGIPISASIFSWGMLDKLVKLPVSFIKFAYSVGYKQEWIDFATTYQGNRPRIVVTSDIMNVHNIPEWCIRLFTVPNQYPVYHPIRWEGIFDRFDGFSDHTLGIEESIRAVQAGCKWLEKHFSLDRADILCPDHAFALKPLEMEQLTKAVK